MPGNFVLNHLENISILVNNLYDSLTKVIFIRFGYLLRIICYDKRVEKKRLYLIQNL